MWIIDINKSYQTKLKTKKNRFGIFFFPRFCRSLISSTFKLSELQEPWTENYSENTYTHTQTLPGTRKWNTIIVFHYFNYLFYYYSFTILKLRIEKWKRTNKKKRNCNHYKINYIWKRNGSAGYKRNCNFEKCFIRLKIMQ